MWSLGNPLPLPPYKGGDTARRKSGGHCGDRVDACHPRKSAFTLSSRLGVSEEAARPLLARSAFRLEEKMLL